MTINLTIVLPFFNIFNSYVCLLRRLWFFIDSRAIWTQRWCFQRYRLRKCCWPRRPEGCPWDYGSYRTGRERIHEHHGSDPLYINICWGKRTTFIHSIKKGFTDNAIKIYVSAGFVCFLFPNIVKCTASQYNTEPPVF